jgi:hypothetical protein
MRCILMAYINLTKIPSDKKLASHVTFIILMIVIIIRIII